MLQRLAGRVGPPRLQTYTPSLSNLTLGNGSTSGTYTLLAPKLGWVRFKFTFGSTSSIGTNPQFTLPAGWSIADDYQVGTAFCYDNSGTATYCAFCRGNPGTPTLIGFKITGSDGQANVTSSAPFTWATNDVLGADLICDLA